MTKDLEQAHAEARDAEARETLKMIDKVLKHGLNGYYLKSTWGNEDLDYARGLIQKGYNEAHKYLLAVKKHIEETQLVLPKSVL